MLTYSENAFESSLGVSEFWESFVFKIKHDFLRCAVFVKQSYDVVVKDSRCGFCKLRLLGFEIIIPRGTKNYKKKKCPLAWRRGAAQGQLCLSALASPSL